MGRKTVDQGNPRATMNWTRRIRSTQAESRGGKVCASKDLQGEGPRKHEPEG